MCVCVCVRVGHLIFGVTSYTRSRPSMSWSDLKRKFDFVLLLLVRPVALQLKERKKERNWPFARGKTCGENSRFVIAHVISDRPKIPVWLADRLQQDIVKRGQHEAGTFLKYSIN